MSTKTYFYISVFLPLLVFGALMTIPHAVSEQMGWIVLLTGGPLAVWSLVSLFVCTSKNSEQIKRYFIRSPMLLLIPHFLLQVSGLVSSLKSPYLDTSWLMLVMGSIWQLLLIGGTQLLVAYSFVGGVFFGYSSLKKTLWIVD